MKFQRVCKYCGKKFATFNPAQKTCSRSKCQIKRKRANVENWRRKHTNYAKYNPNTEIAECYRLRPKIWRKENPERVKERNRKYRAENKEKYRNYMREYMRRYRKRIVEDRKNSSNFSND